IYVEAYIKHEAIVHAYEGNTKEGSHANAEVKLGNLEEFDGLFIFDEAKHGRYKNGRESNKRGSKERSQEQERERHKDCHHHV
ncbi:unnamed protein product, partial [Prunus brigantina]